MTGPLVPPDGIRPLEWVCAVAGAAEGAGFDSFWVTDQVATGDWDATARPPLEAYSVLGALAVRTHTVRLGAIPLGSDRRPPSMLAKIVTGIDVISQGRGILTFGMEEGREDGEGDHRAEGAGPGEQDWRVVEAVQVGRAMLDDESPTFSGTAYAITAAYNRPRPVQGTGVPVVVVVPPRTGPVGLPADSLAALVGAADAVIVRAGPGDVGGMIAGVRGAAPTGTGTTARRAALQWLGVGEQLGGLGPPGSRGPVDVVRVVNSVRHLFGAGVDGCLVPVDAGTSPEDVARVGEALAGSAAAAR